MALHSRSEGQHLGLRRGKTVSGVRKGVFLLFFLDFLSQITLAFETNGARFCGGRKFVPVQPSAFDLTLRQQLGQTFFVQTAQARRWLCSIQRTQSRGTLWYFCRM